GPRGLMPNPRAGTVTFDIGRAVKDIQGGRIEYRVDKTGIIHTNIGKASYSEAQLRDNFAALMDAVVRAKPGSAKGQYLRSVYLGWKVIQYGAGADMKSVFAAISPQRERVNLGLANGVDLDDPDGLLEGDGKAIRHVKLTSLEAAGAPAVKELVRGALQATRNGA